MDSKALLIWCSSLLLVLQPHFTSGQTSVVKGVYWFYDSGFAASSINSPLFTHLLCAFADLDPNTSQVTISSSNQAPFRAFTETVQLKNPSIKTLLSIGGGGSSSSDFASMASQSSSRKSFIDSSINLARSYNFHGLDLDWEFPPNSTVMANFGTLLNEWRAAVDSEYSSNTSSPKLLLTAAVYYSSIHDGVSYPVQDIANSLDWINVMAYDFYGPGWSEVTGPPAALYNPGNQVSGDSGITAWLQAGLSAKKIVLGLPFYGRAWRLADANNHGLFAATTGAAELNDGAPGYRQIREFISENSATTTTVYNETVVTDYLYSGTTWIGYDDTQSISSKVSYVKTKGLLGYFAWQVGADFNDILSTQAFEAWGA
ncbi:hypothetical protein Pint_14531 [Pistacia integerrima]|uniref:Uncharacterized protein n=1 Tax=Pistacia integerrima TaxID=434235 RepID=A0ACC0Y6H2_9ROSI|nr:hypothetical protein Pint_14531 [Pistacia integerrima]